MLGGNFLGTSIIFVFGSSHFGAVLSNLLTLLAVILGTAVLTSFITTRLIKALVK